MTRITRAEAQSRLRKATTYELAGDVRDAHVASIEAALSSLPTPGSSTSRTVSVRRWVVGLAVAAAAMSPVGVAVAAEQALPGDTLYQAKLATETIRSVVDPLVSARHRIFEIEALIEIEADPSVIQATLDAAWDSVRPLTADHPLVMRVELLEKQISVREDAETPPTPPADNLAPSEDEESQEGESEQEPVDEETDDELTDQDGDRDDASVGDEGVEQDDGHDEGGDNEGGDNEGGDNEGGDND